MTVMTGRGRLEKPIPDKNRARKKSGTVSQVSC